TVGRLPEPEVTVSGAHGDLRRGSMLQLYSMESRSRTESGGGRRLRSSTHLAHGLWELSEPCRHLPLLQRFVCEREVDRAILTEKNWVRTDASRAEGQAAFSIKLAHD
ncbi:unnamed protein product, partial [Cladocopium goreaui]